MEDEENNNWRRELLPHIWMAPLACRRNACAYFQQQLLSPLLGRLPRSDNKQQANAILGKSILKIRRKWMTRVTEFSNAGLGNAKPSTWNTRINCRPVVVNVVPASRACGFIRICPFCYTRKCWREYAHLRGILYPRNRTTQDGESIPHSRRKIAALTRRIHFFSDGVPHLEELLRAALTHLRRTRDRDKNQLKLRKLKGWFRSTKLWVTQQQGGGLRLCVETMLLGASSSETGVPMTLFLGTRMDPPKRNASGVVFEKAWYNPKLTMQDFRKHMLKSMRYRPEWLSNDIGVAMAYNRVMLDMRFQQFYGGGEFSHRE